MKSELIRLDLRLQTSMQILEVAYQDGAGSAYTRPAGPPK
jgi:hypothetical protein